MIKYRENEAGLHILEIEITKKCNLNCKHCYVGGNQDVTLSSEVIKDIISQANDIGINRLVFTGGEPLLNKEIFDYANYAKKLGIPDVALLTNGTLVNSEIAKKCKIFTSVQISLDGVPGKVGNLRKDYFKQLENAIYLLKLENISLTLYVTINTQNAFLIDDMINYALNKGCKIAFNCLIPVVDELKAFVLNSTELKLIFSNIVDKSKQNNNIQLSHHFRFLVDKEKMDDFLKSPKDEFIHGGCMAGIAVGYITAEGHFFPCPFIKKSCGNIKNKKLIDIWDNSEILNILRNRKLFKGKCGTCKFVNFCGGCRASSLYKFGDINNSDDNCFL